MAALSETVAKQFLHLSNRSTVTETDSWVEKDEDGRKHEAYRKHRQVELSVVGEARKKVWLVKWKQTFSIDKTPPVDAGAMN